MHRRLQSLAATALAFTLISCGARRHAIEVTLLDPCRLNKASTCDDVEVSPKDRSFCGDSFCGHSADTAHLAVFPGGCPSADVLDRGDLTTAIRVISEEAGRPLPSLGEIDEGHYGFVGLLRGADCRVVGHGCTEANISTIRRVRVEIAPALGLGACDVGSSCQGGHCAAEPEGDTDVCLPWLVASGTLPSLTAADAVVSGPAIVATGDGYLVGYREDSAGENGSRRAKLHLMSLGGDGALAAPVTTQLESCEATASTLGLSMAFASDQGLGATPLPACEGQGAGLHLFTFASNGAQLDSRSFVDAGPSLSIAPTHSLAAARQRNGFELVYTVDDAAYRLGLSGAKPNDAYRPLFASTSAAFAQIATTSDGIAYLVGSTTTADPTLFGFGPWERDPVVQSLVGSTSGAVTAHADRAVAAVVTGEGQVHWRGLGLDGSSLGDGAMEGSRRFGTVDLATVNGSVVLASGRPSEIVLAVITGRDGSLSPRPTLVAQHGPSLGGISLSRYDGGSLAMASAGSQFALAWLDGELTGEAPVGGFAIFDCAKSW